MIIPTIIVAAFIILAIFLLLNKKGSEQEREGLVKEVLNKDAFVVEFDDQKPTVVKFFGISVASENEMMDENIFDFLYQSVLGKRIRVQPKRVHNGEIIQAAIYTLADEYINELMVRQGFARWSPGEAPDDRELAEAQEHAKANQLGVWNPAVRSLLEEKMRKQAAGELTDDDIANMSVDPEELETKRSQEEGND